MTITLDAELTAVLLEQARIQGVPAEQLVLDNLRARFMPPPELPPPQDEWEERLRSIGKNCGTSLTDWAVSSEGIYD